MSTTSRVVTIVLLMLATFAFQQTLLPSTIQLAQAEAQIQRDFNQHQLSAENEEGGGGGGLLNGEDFNGHLAESLAFSVVAASSSNPNLNSNFQCERITFNFCASMPYNFTRMANFFGDSNQIEAAERAKQYELLARTQCSRNLLAYLCELLAPMCLDGEAMKKFEIFPCRSFCRQVPAAFNCEQLPYESNGGNGSLRGPCHETPELSTSQAHQQANSYQAPQLIGNKQHQIQQHQQQQQQQQQRPSVYWPYQKDENVPPFVDNSPIDSRIIRPAAESPMRGLNNVQEQDKRQQQQAASSQSLWSQVQTLSQQLALALLKHSNVLSILTLICLVLVLNAKRLRRAKARLTRDCFATSASSASSRKSSSSASSSGSQRKLAAGAHHKLALSPSSSSRSLMLIAGCDSKRNQTPSHKLINCASAAAAGGHLHSSADLLEPSKKLLHQSGLNQRTLINVNATLERQRQQADAAARYHLMQSIGSHQTAAILTGHNQDNHNNQNSATLRHQYDYIQVPVGASGVGQSSPEVRSSFRMSGARKSFSKSSGRGSSSALTHEPQVYSNILLSSPSHQILLFGDERQQAAASQQQLAVSRLHGSVSDTPPPPPISLPPPLQTGSVQHQLVSACSSYASTQNPIGSLISQQHHRPSLSSGGGGVCDSLSSRYRRATRAHHSPGSLGALPLPPTQSATYASSAASSASSTASSSGGSSSNTSSFSPPGSVLNPSCTSLLLAGHNQLASRNGGSSSRLS